MLYHINLRFAKVVLMCLPPYHFNILLDPYAPIRDTTDLIRYLTYQLVDGLYALLCHFSASLNCIKV